ncbi:carcinoembryonic antigen-related cell adhesion molecule 5-like isoform X2 [Saccostrea cucullata]|uniref:carcinoembryonic antigen-related cell adhesion molecule 5-like isoform X2 n=1 Tax=Saccostrea cuccullata TaxID=36930 RepID=UPI002ED1C18C
MTRLVILVLLLANSVSLLKIFTPSEVRVKLQRNITLSCNYAREDKEEISDRKIIWQKHLGNKYVDVAYFSVSGKPDPSIHKDFKKYLENRTHLIAPQENLTTATLIINHAVCSDEGLYRCWIEFYLNDAIDDNQNQTSVIFQAEASEPDEFIVEHTNKLEENQSVRFICNADVGNPPGYLQIWKIPGRSTDQELIYSSNFTNNTFIKTDNCSYFLNVSFTYNVSRNDNGAVFNCTSQNDLTRQPGPYKDSKPISVLYGPEKAVITLTPSLSVYSVGDEEKLDCLTISNPPPVYSWGFLSTNSSEEEHTINLDRIGSSLLLKNLQTNNSGDYICSAFNTFNGKTLNVTAVVRLSVKNPEIQLTSAYPMSDAKLCQPGEICKEKKGQSAVSINIWMVLSIIFILLTVIFVSTTAYSFIKEKPNLQSCLREKDVNMSPSLETKGRDNSEETDQDGNKLYDTAWR